ncbi:MAG: hypothetical protein JO115_08370 [Pseudonocardiales bacterium]|nr:hypothetical protein [Pseudonocardiales bacterium]
MALPVLMHQADRFSAANPLVAVCRDWRKLPGAELLTVDTTGPDTTGPDTTGPETSCGAAVVIVGSAALGRRIIAWHPTPSGTFAEGREPNWRNLMIQYSIHARVSESSSSSRPTSV